MSDNISYCDCVMFTPDNTGNRCRDCGLLKRRVPESPVRVVTMELDGASFTMDRLDDLFAESMNAMVDDTDAVYTVRFHTMSRDEFDALPEFGGF